MKLETQYSDRNRKVLEETGGSSPLISGGPL